MGETEYSGNDNCGKCGSEIQADSIYCMMCGQELQLITVRPELGKYISSKKKNGKEIFSINLEAENIDDRVRDIKILDLIPFGFELVEDSIEIKMENVYLQPREAKHGFVHGWIFMNIAPDQLVNVQFKLIKVDEIANSRILLSVYKY